MSQTSPHLNLIWKWAGRREWQPQCLWGTSPWRNVERCEWDCWPLRHCGWRKWSWNWWGCRLWTWHPPLGPLHWGGCRCSRRCASSRPPARWGGRRPSRVWRRPCKAPGAGWSSPILPWTGCSGGGSTCGCVELEACTQEAHLLRVTVPGEKMKERS